MDFSRLIWEQPWMAPVVMNLRNIIETTDIPLIGITPDGKTLYYNPVLWQKLSPDECLGVQLHEMLHIVHLHAVRRDGRETELWNIACDMAINYQILNSGYTLPPTGDSRTE